MSTPTTNSISEVTRRRIFDNLSGSEWCGLIDEHEFLARLYDLSTMPSNDHRFPNASADIWQHRVRNQDWSYDWVLFDKRLDLLKGPDEMFLRFIAETIHPITSRKISQTVKLLDMFNEYLRVDGWELYKTHEVSGAPVFSYRRVGDDARTHLDGALKIAERMTGQYVMQQVQRLGKAVDNEPDLAIGTAKEFLETLCKTILKERNEAYSPNEDFPALIKLTIKCLPIVPPGVKESAHSEKSIRVLLNNLGSIGTQLAEIRNQFGTGHGKDKDHIGLQRHHAKLAVGAAATLASFLFDCHSIDGDVRKDKP